MTSDRNPYERPAAPPDNGADERSQPVSEYFAEFRERRARRTWDRGQARDIRTIGDPVLRSACDPVRAFDQSLCRLVDDMFVTMYAADGVGLAANQIGVGRCVFVFDCADDEGVWHRGVVVNPTVVEADGEVLDEGEGCLSLPGFSTALARPSRVTVRGQDVDGAAVEITGTGYFARCLLHEADHLRGRLFTDLVTGDSRKAALRAIRAIAAP
jgi:peptide deformylase